MVSRSTSSSLPPVFVERTSIKGLLISSTLFEKQLFFAKYGVTDQKELSEQQKKELLQRVVRTTKRFQEGIPHYRKFLSNIERDRLSHIVNLTVFDFLLYRIEVAAKKVLLHLRGDLSFKQTWSQFLLQVATVRYESGEGGDRQRTKNLVDKIVGEIKQRFEELGLSGEVVNKELLDLIIKYPNGMDSYLFYYLLKGQTFKNGIGYRYTMNIEDLLESIAFSYKRFQRTLIELRNHFRAHLDGFHYLLYEAKDDSTLFALNPNAYLKELNGLIRIVGSYYQLTSRNCKALSKVGSSFSKVVSILDPKQGPSQYGHLHTLCNTRRAGIAKMREALVLIEDGKISEEEFKQKFGEGTPFNWNDVQISLSLMEEYEKFHMIFDTYVFPSFYGVKFHFEAFLEWFKKNGKRSNLQQIINTRRARRPNTNESVDVLMKRITGTGGGRSRRRRRRTPTRPARKTSEAASPVKNRVEAPLPTTPQPTPQPVVVKVAPLLSELVASQKDLQQKIALRDALVHWDDLTIIVNDLRQKKVPSVGDALFFVRSSYYFVEQVCVYVWQSKNKENQGEILTVGHNLKRMLIKLGLSAKCAEPLVEDLYMAGFWTRRPFQEMALWQEYEEASYDPVQKPKMLMALNERLKNPSKDIPELSKQQLLAMYEAVKAFAKPFLGDIRLEDKRQPKGRVSLILNQLQTAVGKRIQTLLRKICREGVDELREADLFYKLLVESVKAMGQNEMDLRTLSSRVRRMSFYLTALMESLLQSLSSAKQGGAKDRWNTFHDLGKLYSETFEKTTEKGMAVIARFKGSHRVNRYLYQKAPETSLQKVMMAAELLKECPELTQGFKLEGNKTPLNFYPIPATYLNAKNISKELQSILSNALDFADKELLPELTRSFR